MMRSTSLLCLLILVAPAAAYHRQTAPIVQLTYSGDTALPRVRAAGARLAVVMDTNGSQVFRSTKDRKALSPVTTQGDNQNPTISAGGIVVAWDADCASAGCPEPGRQIFLLKGTRVTQVTHDPTGTSVNPALSGRGRHLVFESSGDLAGLGDPQIPHVFVWNGLSAFRRVSQGVGPSHNPVLNRFGTVLAFDSTSNPTTGADTGIAQIWLAHGEDEATAITAGNAPSTRPMLSKDGRILAFQSRAALATDGHDTGKTQIFAYDNTGRRFAQLTSESSGCTNPSVEDASSDYRIAYTCDGEAYVQFIFADQRYRMPIDVGDTAQAVAEPGAFFVVVSTTANLLGTGVTSGHQIYQLNLFKLAADPVSGSVTWFPATP
jgi:Tol biopolymer transport system component